MPTLQPNVVVSLLHLQQQFISSHLCILLYAAFLYELVLSYLLHCETELVCPVLLSAALCTKKKTCRVKSGSYQPHFLGFQLTSDHASREGSEAPGYVQVLSISPCIILLVPGSFCSCPVFSRFQTISALFRGPGTVLSLGL